MKGIAGMVTRRIRKLIAWVIAAGVVGLVVVGGYYVSTLV